MKFIANGIAALVFALALPNSPVQAQEMPIQGLARYEPYRTVLIAKGWRPIKSSNATDERMPEVSCGNSMCIAEWRGRKGREVSITLWFIYGNNDQQVLYLAPQI
jgi:hypothetical protein